MSRGENQKLKLAYLTRIMLEKTDEEHALTLAQIIQELEARGVTAERKSLYNDFADMTVSYRITCNNGNQRTLINP